jgi:hypothetical protein
MFFDDAASKFQEEKTPNFAYILYYQNYLVEGNFRLLSYGYLRAPIPSVQLLLLDVSISISSIRKYGNVPAIS